MSKGQPVLGSDPFTQETYFPTLNSNSKWPGIDNTNYEGGFQAKCLRMAALNLLRDANAFSLLELEQLGEITCPSGSWD